MPVRSSSAWRPSPLSPPEALSPALSMRFRLCSPLWPTEQHVPGLVLLMADQGVLAVGTEPSVPSGLASGAGQAVVAAGFAVLGPSARLEVPAAEGPQPFFAAFSRA
jgi:hypothetical protein